MAELIKIAIVAHQMDNQKSVDENSVSWIEAFYKGLSVKISQILKGTPEIDVLFPQDLVGGSQREPKAYQVIIPVYSQWFIRSQDCVEVCCDVIQSSALNNEPKVFVVCNASINPALYPLAIQADQMYHFWSQDNITFKSTRFEPKSSETEKFFWSKIDDIANDIAQIKISQEEILVQQETNGICVYLSECSQDLVVYRDQLKRELGSMGITVYPEKELTHHVTSATAEIRKYLVKSNISIHMLGSEYGTIPQGSNRSIVEIQNDIAEEVFSTQPGKRFLWVPDNAVATSDRQAELLNDAKTSMKNIGSAEVVVGFIELFKNVIKENLQKEINIRKKEKEEVKRLNGKKVYVICDFNDKSDIDIWMNHQQSEEITFLFSAFESDEKSIRTSHMNHLISADALIFLKNTGSDKWLKMRTNEVMRARAYGREKIDFPAVIIRGTKHKGSEILHQEIDTIEINQVKAWLSQL